MSVQTQSQPPEISIITPCYNANRFLESCVGRLAAQSCGVLEHIIVDGGSKDGTQETLTRLAARYPHLRWTSERDSGQSQAMNRGIALARGQLISFLNADDYYEPGVLNRVATLARDKAVPALLIGRCQTHDSTGVITYEYSPAHAGFVEFLRGEFPSNPTAYFYHRSLHNLIGLYDESDHFTMDYDFLLRAAKVATLHRYQELWGHFVLQETSKTAMETSAHRAQTRLAHVAQRYFTQLTPSEKIFFFWRKSLVHGNGTRVFMMHLKHPRILAGSAWKNLRRLFGYKR